MPSRRNRAARISPLLGRAATRGSLLSLEQDLNLSISTQIKALRTLLVRSLRSGQVFHVCKKYTDRARPLTLCYCVAPDQVEDNSVLEWMVVMLDTL